ncbi:LysR family transcriptional regulator OS=Streptomyces antimycoticus OX=68175 GN=gltC_2 PE=3 SV=1 [Streptomyces antimycoticus]
MCVDATDGPGTDDGRARTGPGRLRVRNCSRPGPRDTAAMDPHLLRTFVSVARCGSFSDAAHELGFTPAAVSEHIASLEADLRTSLLTRRPVMLTSAGARLLEHAGPLLLRLDAARADVERLSGAGAARLVVGASPLAMTPRIAAALDRVRQAHPAIRASLRILGRREIPAAVASGALDLGLVDGPTTPTDALPLPEVGPLTSVTVAEAPLVVALPTGHPLARRLGLRLADLAEAQLAGRPGRRHAAGAAARGEPEQRLPASLTYEGADDGLVALTAAGHGLALLPTRPPRAPPASSRPP